VSVGQGRLLVGTKGYSLGEILFSVSDGLFMQAVKEVNREVLHLHQVVKSPDFTKRHKAEFAWLLMSLIHLSKSCLTIEEIDVAINMGKNIDWSEKPNE